MAGARGEGAAMAEGGKGFVGMVVLWTPIMADAASAASAAAALV